MWRMLFGGPWADSENILPASVQEQAGERIRHYWLFWGWQFVLGEVVIWGMVTFQDIEFAPLYGVLCALIVAAYLLGWQARYMTLWLVGSLFLFLIHGMLINGLGAVTALSVLMPYTIAGMLFSGRRRFWIQLCCVAAFWANLVYEAFPLFDQLAPPGYIVVSYNILLAAFIFQTLRFLNHIAVEINTAHVADEIQQRSQRFLARVSHELRTPLNSVQGFAKLLQLGDLPPRQQNYLQQIVDESRQLNQLVSDLLDSAHLATGKLTLNLEACDINAICQVVATEHQPNLPEAVSLHVDLADAMPLIQADPLRMRQVISNLMSNAVKYTAQGSITIQTRHDRDHLEVIIRDTGIGISESQQSLIFLPFVQLDNRQIGVGLGLDIAMQLVRLHGGELLLESIEGQGSTFTIKLPI